MSKRLAILTVVILTAFLSTWTAVALGITSTSSHSRRTCWGCATPQEKAKWKAAVMKNFGTGWEGRLALCISYRESGYNPYAVSRTNDHGGAQFNRPSWENNRDFHRRTGHWITWSKIYSVEYSAWLFRQVVKLYGWGPWGGRC